MTIRCPHCGHEIMTPRSTGLTPQQNAALDFIREHIDEYGYSPTLEEIAREIGTTSKSAVHRIVERLRERGFIRKEPALARSIQLVEAA